MATAHEKPYKVLLVGDGATGKTSFLTRHLTGRFDPHPTATVGVEMNPVLLHTNRGELCFHCWDTAGHEGFGGMLYQHFAHADAAVLFFDTTARQTYHNVLSWHRDVTRACDKIPMILVANKVDAPDREVKGKAIRLHRRMGIPMCELSVKSGYNFRKPFLWLARMLTNDATLELVDPPTEHPDQQQQQQQQPDTAALPT